MGKTKILMDIATILTDTTAKRYFAKKEDSENGLPTFRKQVLKKGKFTHPQFIDEKITIGNKEIGLIVTAFKDGAFDKVPILLGTHDEGKIERTVGEVIALHKTKAGLDATIEIADELTATKIKTKGSSGKGLISAVSVSIGPVVTDEGQKFKLALWHLALVTHPHFSKMTDFKELAALLPHNDVQIFVNEQGGIEYVNAENLDERVRRIRDTFWEEFGRDSQIFSWVQEVHNDFIIVTNKNGLFQYDYKIDKDGEVDFESPVRVKVQYIPVEATVSKDEGKDTKNSKSSKKKLNADVLAILAENGITFGSMDEIKASVEASNKVKALMAKVGVEEGDYEALEAHFSSLEDDKKGLSDRITVLETTKLESEATSEVEGHIREGKITPAQKEHYVALRTSNPELYASMLKDAPIVVDLEERGHNDGVSDHSQGMTEEEFQADKQRLVSTSSLSSNGKTEKEGS